MVNKAENSVIIQINEIRPRPTNEPHIGNPTNCLLFWRVYFNFGYYLCIIPFRFKENFMTGRLEIYENSLQKIVSAFVTLLGISATLARFRSFSIKSVSDDPAQFAQFMPVFLDFAYQLVFVYVYRCRSRVFPTVVHKFQNSDPQRPEKSRKRNILAIILCTFLAVMSPNRSFDSDIKRGWKLDSFFDVIAMLYLGDDRNIPNYLVPPVLFSKLISEMTIQYVDLMNYLTVIELYELVTEFQSSLTANADIHDVLAKYHNLKYQSVLLNKAIQPILVTYFISSLPFNVSIFSGILVGDVSFVPLFFLGLGTGFMCLAASTNKKIDAFKEWITKRRHDINHDDLIVILNEFTPRSDVGLTVGGLFPINYGFLGSCLGLLLTYTIVLAEMRTSKAQNPQ